MAQLLSRQWGARDSGDARFYDFLNWVLKKIKLPEVPRVLEFGCGTGESTRLMADRLGRQGQIVAVDERPRAIRLARASTKPTRYPRIEFRTLDLPRWPFREAEFDFVFSARALMFAEQPLLILGEIARVLKSHGQYLAVEEDLAGYSLAQLSKRNPDAPPRLNPYISRELPALCLLASLEPSELFPNYVASREPLPREELERQGRSVRTLRPRLHELGRADLNDYLRESERAVSVQSAGAHVTLMELGVLALKP